jgi:GH24 family phage-related lysozyme (muramidase)
LDGETVMADMFPAENLIANPSVIADGKVTGLQSLPITRNNPVPPLPKKEYEFKNAEYVPYLMEKEGNLAYQTKKGSYDPNTQEFITYLDSVGVPTIGYGTTSKSSSKFNVKEGQRIPLYVADMALDQEIDEKLKAVKKYIPDFNKLPPKLRIPMLSSFYRGGLSGSKKTMNLINKGDFIGASKEFLDNNEYRAAKKEGSKSKGVADRMEELSNIFREYGIEQNKTPDKKRIKVSPPKQKPEIKKRASGSTVVKNYNTYEPRSI